MLDAVTAAHLAVIALSVGRRVLSLLDAGAVSREDVQALAQRHDLAKRWRAFEQRYLHE